MADLSPAAQTVMDAFNNAPFDEEHGDPHAIAAALRALADFQPPPWQFGDRINYWFPDEEIRRELRNLAEELEGGDD